ncbi:biotin--protein ligase-like [Tigriopus californicus]|uniref:biotin--protein ligase-like n=1 Tax=Tigriopus californicus TaxID=6832 RepID=UPI0027DA40FA|nr:biotin--protein ligase-like [Tigriopus californicus]
MSLGSRLNCRTIMRKPPNILVFPPSIQGGQAFERLKTLLVSILEPHSYTIYPLKGSECRQSLWMDHTQLLINLESSRSDPDILTRFQSYLRSPEAMLLHLNPEEGLATHLKLDRFSTLMPPSHRLWYPVCLEKVDESVLKDILGQHFGLRLQSGRDSYDANLKGPGYLYASDEVIRLKALNLHDQWGPELSVHDVVRLESPLFNRTAFLRRLQTRYLGRILLFYPVIGSTFEPLERSVGNGVVVMADQQSAGQGRGGNAWLSPPGCLMFSLQLGLDVKSGMVQRVSLIQHLIALALVHAISQLTAPSENSLRLKWPNDIYLGSDTKMGGVLAKSSFCGSEVTVNLGLGFNLDNALPTLSLNSILDHQLSREVVLAEVLNVLEDLLNQLERGQIESLLQLYHRYWLHQDQVVRVKHDASDEISVMIKSIDEFGFLNAERLDTRASLTLHPDGNSFDMFQGLILSKR